MDRNVTNSVISRLPIAMAGIVHAYRNNGRSLSICMNSITRSQSEMPILSSF